MKPHLLAFPSPLVAFPQLSAACPPLLLQLHSGSAGAVVMKPPFPAVSLTTGTTTSDSRGEW